jgi:hypothetical protein
MKNDKLKKEILNLLGWGELSLTEMSKQLQIKSHVLHTSLSNISEIKLDPETGYYEKCFSF